MGPPTPHDDVYIIAGNVFLVGWVVVGRKESQEHRGAENFRVCECVVHFFGRVYTRKGNMRVRKRRRRKEGYIWKQVENLPRNASKGAPD